jgi:hypothetical protein
MNGAILHFPRITQAYTGTTYPFTHLRKFVDRLEFSLIYGTVPALSEA